MTTEQKLKKWISGELVTNDFDPSDLDGSVVGLKLEEASNINDLGVERQLIYIAENIFGLQAAPGETTWDQIKELGPEDLHIIANYIEHNE